MKRMTSSEIREAFLAYFEKNGHTRVRSSSLVPESDPTLFFTNAGMVQFKDTFTGLEKRAYNRACSSQKCMRVSGKHNDLENVGHTPRHHTFFEMLGNFSFGDYFKKEAIEFGWNFLTKEMGLDPERMYITVFREDDEAAELWKKHIPENRIFRLDEKDNFWSMGDTGPCGPCAEIHWDFGEGEVTEADFETDRFMEIWNLVFMQYNRDESGELKPLAAPSIDTGMGLERLTAVMNGVQSSWETDLFMPIIKKAAEVCDVRVGESRDADIALRVIADHIRGSVFLIGDGVIPSNEGRGYVLRRILRRAIRYGKRLGRNEPFLAQIAHVVVDEMGSSYPDLITHQNFIEKVISAEDVRFYQTLDNGLELLMNKMERAKKRVIPGEVAFRLYDTYGFPLDVTEIIAAENGFKVDVKGFNEHMDKQRERARSSWKGSGELAVEGIFKELVGDGMKSDFVGYAEMSAEVDILAVIVDGKRVKQVGEGVELQFIANATPFYGESGGQAGDRGVALAEGVEIEIVGTKKPLSDITVHVAKVKRGVLSEGARMTLAIDADARDDMCRNHTATHLLHRALRDVLGDHVKQAGSLVEPGRLRFDFSHFQALTREEMLEIEQRVNGAVRRNYPVITLEMSYDEAVEQGAIALFGEKYGDRVRMIDVSGHSRELCGGTHVSATGEIGIFKIVSESSVAAGVRRIEAVTGRGVECYIDDIERQRAEIAKIVKAQPAEVVDRVSRLVEQVSKLEKDLRKAINGAASGRMNDLLSEVKEVDGVKVLAAKVEAPDRKILGEWAEKYRDKLGEGVVVLGSVIEDKVVVIATVSKSLTPAIHAGKIVKVVSEQVGGKGGGRPDFAQGGGNDAANLDSALAGISDKIKNG
jgi:alanyl-tRNA synthetase